MKTQALLKRFGFSENETKVYLAALECGLSSAQDIAKVAGLKRTTAYSVLSYLVDRGVVGKSKVRNKTRFLAEPPERLLSLVGELQASLKQALPELQAIYNKNEIKPKITFYEGKEAIRNVYEDTLRERPTEILEWNTNAFFDRLSKEYNYIEQRVAYGIKARRIAGKGSQWDKKHKDHDQKELAETLIVPKERFDPQIEINIYANKLALMNYAENMSVIIESKAVADAMRQIYELSWIGAKQVGNPKVQ
ncbi:MAG: hypothetical protein COV91_01200 [Candidatus Taylorbacteria bacterium CG11_big_fil_rev_8_21_14_0_20_46_11]|uniref:Transcription regulator TrmB N-terminal domain-containing protein n=1 Tax=Candidatus Taylorbacteria bacterium CG11_big_fil_rev_8_21_14_0_20_46_11 TaxID=1975025 RepID=A0A2H0KEG5_9BACT|nr:MAG: hypothetical protein COV91_01200 [Candidatus Taylorbacteria bacterium CG11_big_fil_rev_8_21_14_0_20_46_11]